MKKSFTLIELLIVLVIIGVLVTLAVPQYQALREKAIAVEAVNIMEGVKQNFAMLAAQGISGEKYEEHYGRIPDAEYWRFVTGWGSDTHYFVRATRNGGPYDMYDINLNWDSSTGETLWGGSHPGVPGGPTTEFNP